MAPACGSSSPRAGWDTPLEWNGHAKYEIEATGFSELQKHAVWGYAFTDGKQEDCHLFMLHGYKPVTESGKASFFRFEWPWDTPHEEIFAFANEIAGAVPFLSGTGGYILQSRPLDLAAYDYVFAQARRYWGLEAWNLDLSVQYLLEGYKCPSWLTLIGNRLLEKLGRPPRFGDLAPLQTATAHGYVFRSRDLPDVIDRNYNAPYPGEQAIARALAPLQVKKHAPFGGTRWDEQNTGEWLRRFG